MHLQPCNISSCPLINLLNLAISSATISRTILSFELFDCAIFYPFPSFIGYVILLPIYHQKRSSVYKSISNLFLQAASKLILFVIHHLPVTQNIFIVPHLSSCCSIGTLGKCVWANAQRLTFSPLNILSAVSGREAPLNSNTDIFCNRAESGIKKNCLHNTNSLAIMDGLLPCVLILAVRFLICARIDSNRLW